MPPSALASSGGGPASSDLPQNGNYSSFPVVKTDELVAVLTEMGLSITADDVIKPQGHVAHRVFIAFLECLSGTNQDLMDRSRQTALAQMEYRELYEDGLQFLMLFREVKDMMQTATIFDFQLQDMTRPNPKRFKRQMSALVNFYRFRSDRIIEFDELITGSEDLENKRNEVEDDIDRQRSDLQRIKMERELDEPKARKLKEINAKITDDLLAARNVQKQTMDELEDLKKKKDTLAIKHAELAQEKFQIMEKITYLEARVVSSPTKMKNSVKELHDQLERDNYTLQETQRKVDRFKNNVEVLDNLCKELDACMNLMHEVNLEMVKAKEELQNQKDLQGLCVGVNNQIASLRHSLEMTDYELNKIEEKLNRNRKNLSEITEKHNRKTVLLQQGFEVAKHDKQKKMAIAETKNIESEKIETKLAELEEAFENYQKKVMRQKDAVETAAKLYITTLTNTLQLERFSV